MIDNIKAYRDHPNLNYSLLKSVIENTNYNFKPSLAMTLGSCLDCLLTCPEDFDKMFIVKDIKRPTSDLVKYIEKRFETHQDFNVDEILTLAKLGGFGGKTYTDSKIISLIQDLEYWYEILEQKKTLEFVTEKEKKNAEYWVHRLRTQAPTKNILNKDLKYQTPLFTTLKFPFEGGELEADVKCLPDFLYEGKEEILLYDLKRTTYSLNNWNKSAIENKYYLQMALYHDIVAQIYNKPVTCYWVIVSSASNKVAVKEVHDFDLKLGRDGGEINKGFLTIGKGQQAETLMRNTYINGYRDAIVKLVQAQQLGLYDYDIEYFRFNGFYAAKSIFV